MFGGCSAQESIEAFFHSGFFPLSQSPPCQLCFFLQQQGPLELHPFFGKKAFLKQDLFPVSWRMGSFSMYLQPVRFDFLNFSNFFKERKLSWINYLLMPSLSCELYLKLFFDVFFSVSVKFQKFFVMKYLSKVFFLDRGRLLFSTRVGLGPGTWWFQCEAPNFWEMPSESPILGSGGSSRTLGGW